MRTKLPSRRHCITRKVCFSSSSGVEHEFLLSYGLDAEGTVREVFCADDYTIGTDINAILSDGCILISLYLQTGGEPERLVRSLGQERPPGQDHGPPSSLLGAIALAVLNMQHELDLVRAA